MATKTAEIIVAEIKAQRVKIKIPEKLRQTPGALEWQRIECHRRIQLGIPTPKHSDPLDSQ